MFSWSSLFPFELPTLGLPTFSIPANIQRRFISFVLRQSLGKFVRPGQLDDEQVDSQIGSGFIEISRIELADEGVNGLLDRLPVRLRGGSIGKISAQIPWSNIWWAPLDVTVEGLDVSLVLTEVPPAAPPAAANVNLTASVSDVAETFVHQELNPLENRVLRETIHQAKTPSAPDGNEPRLPGALDPFTTRDVGNLSSEEDFEAEEVSFLTSLTQSLLSRLRVTLRNTSVAIIDDDHAKVTLHIPDVHFGSEDAHETLQENTAEPEQPGTRVRAAVTRTLRMSSISASMMNIERSRAVKTPTYGTLDESDSSSSEDETALKQMASSMLSIKSSTSMYHSALSLHSLDVPTRPPPSRETSAEIFSINDPIQVRVTSLPTALYRSSSSKPKVVAGVNIGVIAAAIERWHVRALLNFMRFIPQSTSTIPVHSPPRLPTIKDTLLMTMEIRAVVALLVTPSLGHSRPENIDRFFARPLSPYTDCSHVRLQVDQIEASLSKKLDTDTITPRILQQLDATVSDASILYFEHFKSSNNVDSGSFGSISPIMIFDLNLSQFAAAHRSTMYPFMDISVEWEKPGNTLRPSTWRVRAPKRDPSGAQIPGATSERHHAVSFNTTVSPEQRGEALLQPIHLFIDPGVVSGYIVPYLDGALSPIAMQDEDDDSVRGRGGGRVQEPADDAVLETPRPRHAELEVDEEPAHINSPYNFRLHCAVIRLEVRPPPYEVHGAPVAYRSGTVVVDLYGLVISTIPGSTSQPGSKESSGRHAAFYSIHQPLPTARPSKQDSGELLCEARWQAILVAFASVGDTRATTQLTIGSIVSFDGPGRLEGPPNLTEVPLPPRLSIRSSKASEVSSQGQVALRSRVYIDCALPQLRVSLHKPPLDGLQLWADDFNQWAQKLASSSPPPSHFGEFEFEGENLIGSRFFARGPAKSISSSATTNSRTKSGTLQKGSSSDVEAIVSLAITEASVQLWVPREDSAVFDSPEARPFNIAASDIAVVLHSRPDGKDETVVDVAILDVRAADKSADEQEFPLLFLTKSRSVTSALIPMIHIRFASVTVSDTAAKESRVKASLHGFTLLIADGIAWMDDVGAFVKAPPGAFETVIPSERTILSLNVSDCSIQLRTPTHPGSVVGALNNLEFAVDMIGNSPEMSTRLKLVSGWILAIDNLTSAVPYKTSARNRSAQASDYWRRSGFARLLEIRDLGVHVKRNSTIGGILNKVDIPHVGLFIALCTDSMTAVGAFISEFSNTISSPTPNNPTRARREGSVLRRGADSHMASSLDEHAFARPPEFTADADMIRDNLPLNTEYLEDSFGAAAGFRDITEDDLEDFIDPDDPEAAYAQGSNTSRGVAHETIRILDPLGVRPVEYYFDNMIPEDLAPRPERLTTSVRIHDSNVTLSLHAGFDWQRTRDIVKEEVDAMRRRLLRIRQLVSTGEAPHEDIEDAHTTLFNSVYIGLPPEADDLEGDALLAAIDEQLEEGDETASQGSWQTLDKLHIPSTVTGAASRQQGAKPLAQRLARSKRPSIQFCFSGIEAEHDIYPADAEIASRLLVTATDVEILDHIKTSTWRKFLTQMREDSRGNVRETDSNMLRVELVSVRPVVGDTSEEARLRAKILPLRLHVDQDALDFITNFFAFSDPDAVPTPAEEPDPSKMTFFQHVDIFPVEIKLDYKPKRVDYRALREGRTLELMNFFHFDGSEMTLRHIEMFGETGWGPMLEKLNDLWSPDVKAHQLAEVISGVEPIRSFVNVGSGVADLVLLPIAQYKKDGRIMRGLQKGATSFVKTTALEALTIGARLANGTQIILEQAESFLGGGPSPVAQAELENSLLRWESVGTIGENDEDEDDYEGEYGFAGEDIDMTMSIADLSRYAHQPTNVQEGLRSAYKSLGKNLGEAAQTILAVPIEVYERSGTEGPVRAVIRALPVAVLKPMIGASEAVSKTLLGLRGTLDPNVRDNVEEKYKKVNL